MPIADMSVEHSHRVRRGSSTSTPKIERVRNAPGASHWLTLPRGETRNTPPLKLPTNRSPARLDVTLSGKMSCPSVTAVGAAALAATPSTRAPRAPSAQREYPIMMLAPDSDFGRVAHAL